MKNIQVFIVALAILLVTTTYLWSPYEKARIIGIPTSKEMTEKEKDFFDGLLPGDTMVRACLENGDTIHVAISVERWEKNDPTIEVGKFYNENRYFVKKEGDPAESRGIFLIETQ